MRCDTKLKPWHNIPVISWIFLKAKCSHCHNKISMQYPAIELLCGFVFFILSLKFGINFPIFLIALSFLTLIALSMIDFRYKMVPDSLNLLALFFAIFGAWSIDGAFLNFQNALLFAGGFSILRFSLSYILTTLAYNKIKKRETSWSKNYHTHPFIEAMGEGDIMVAATIGALLGIKLGLFSIFLSSLLALPVMILLLGRSAEEQRVPFVPFLTLATFSTYINDTQILNYIEANY
jgi:leader peptidase (prepilin peptidase)/N-methyltransferase